MAVLVATPLEPPRADAAAPKKLRPWRGRRQESQESRPQTRPGAWLMPGADRGRDALYVREQMGVDADLVYDRCGPA